MSALSDLSDGCIASDHGHDPFIMVMKRPGRLPIDVAKDIFCRPIAALLGNGSQLRKRFAVRARNIGEIAQRINPGIPFQSQVGFHVQPSAPPLRQAACFA